jgi:hypothetical protein
MLVVCLWIYLWVVVFPVCFNFFTFMESSLATVYCIPVTRCQHTAYLVRFPFVLDPSIPHLHPQSNYWVATRVLCSYGLCFYAKPTSYRASIEAFRSLMNRTYIQIFSWQLWHHYVIAFVKKSITESIHVEKLLSGSLDRGSDKTGQETNILYSCEISSSHGGEYDVQSCLLGYTAV